MPVPSEVISTSVSSLHRAVSVLHEDGVTERYCLMRRPNGDVGWFLDRFEREMVGGPSVWTAHGGALTVGAVLTRVPAVASDVLRWTRQEVEDGPDVVDVDLFSRDRRARSLERLARELADASR